MLQRVLVIGLLGPLSLTGGCSSGITGGFNSSDAPGASASQPTEPTAADKAAQTKQITLSVSGMT
jgi:hypothetical protein